MPVAIGHPPGVGATLRGPAAPVPRPTWHWRRAARVLARGGVVAYPTEAVYGIGCDPANESAVRRLLAIKRRPARKGLILIAADFEQLRPWLQPLPGDMWQRIVATWPGPVTWLLPVRPGVPTWLRGSHGTLAVRVTAHPVAAGLCRTFGGPIVSTSANLSGRPPARTAQAARWALGGALDLVVPGQAGPQRRPTEIRDARTGAILRRG